jgi:hypothetical protein
LYFDISPQARFHRRFSARKNYPDRACSQAESGTKMARNKRWILAQTGPGNYNARTVISEQNDFTHTSPVKHFQKA